MAEIKMNVKTILCYMDMSSETFAEQSGIKVNHLRAIMANRAKMTADDLKKIHKLTNLPYESISGD